MIDVRDQRDVANGEFGHGSVMVPVEGPLTAHGHQ
jgi:hypothetical protein